jgi:hypothetical protein
MALLRHLSGFIKGLPGGALELRLKCLLCEIQLLHRQLKRHRLHTHTHTHTQVLNLLALLVQSANTDSATCFTGVPTTHLLYWHQKITGSFLAVLLSLLALLEQSPAP